MIRNYIIYTFNCAWRYLDRHGGNPTIGVRLAAEFSPLLTPSPAILTHVHTLSAISAYSLHELYWILHGIMITQDLRLRRMGCRRRLPLDIRDYCTTWQDTRYFKCRSELPNWDEGRD